MEDEKNLALYSVVAGYPVKYFCPRCHKHEIICIDSGPIAAVYKCEGCGSEILLDKFLINNLKEDIEDVVRHILVDRCPVCRCSSLEVNSIFVYYGRYKNDLVTFHCDRCNTNFRVVKRDTADPLPVHKLEEILKIYPEEDDTEEDDCSVVKEDHKQQYIHELERRVDELVIEKYNMQKIIGILMEKITAMEEREKHNAG